MEDNDLLDCTNTNNTKGGITALKNLKKYYAQIAYLKELRHNPYTWRIYSMFIIDFIQNTIMPQIESIKRLNGCYAANAIKISNLFQQVPYNDPFFSKTAGLTGENSSSYFYRLGFCDTTIDNEAECTRKGFEWTKGGPMNKNQDQYICRRGRYMYVQNTPGYPNAPSDSNKGILGSVMGDMMAMSPEKLINASQGNGSLDIDFQTCPGKSNPSKLQEVNMFSYGD